MKAKEKKKKSEQLNLPDRGIVRSGHYHGPGTMSKDFQHRRLYGEKSKTFSDEIFFFFLPPPYLTRRTNGAVYISGAP